MAGKNWPATKIREKDIEIYLRDQVKAIGGKAYKFTSPGNDGVPDRLVGLPGGIGLFVETKAPGKSSTDLQKLQQKRLRDLGFTVFRDIDSKEKVDGVISYCRNRMLGYEEKVCRNLLPEGLKENVI